VVFEMEKNYDVSWDYVLECAIEGECAKGLMMALNMARSKYSDQVAKTMLLNEVGASLSGHSQTVYASKDSFLVLGGAVGSILRVKGFTPFPVVKEVCYQF
jgi:hypothetical protein